MLRAVSTPHRLVNPETLSPAVGFAHAVVASPGRAIHLGGQGPLDRHGVVTGRTMLEQFETTAANVVTALNAAGAQPEHLVSMQIFVTDAVEYRADLEQIGRVYRRHFGRHYPALALFEVSRLMDEGAKIELMCVAVVPD
jgi:enamine deaminase RidA (YjgF/YER057c/UK114 family)